MSFLQKPPPPLTARRNNPHVPRFNTVVFGGKSLSYFGFCTIPNDQHQLTSSAVAGGVGKSALTVRFVKNSFNEAYNPTIEGIFELPVISVSQVLINLCRDLSS